MFRGLHIRLTLLYLIAALALIAMVGAGTYVVIGRYFVTTTDLALQHKMSLEFRMAGLPVPASLANADRDWYASREGRLPWESPPPPPASAALPRATAPASTGGDGHDDEHSEQHAQGDLAAGTNTPEDTLDGELAAIFVLPMNAQGQLISSANVTSSSIPPDQAAALAAVSSGSDWRTVKLSDGTRVRLYTQQINVPGGPAVIQLGRTLTDQDRILNELLIGLLGLGGLSVLLLGVGSWWLAGRSLRPAQQAWERQQAFVANASHELRAPLTLMRASTEVARRSVPKSDEDGRALLNDVLQECDHMSGLVEDLLLLSRLDAGRVKVERTPVEMPQLLGDVGRQVGRVASDKGVELLVIHAEGTAIGDAVRLRQVLIILLDNALRYTPAGGTIAMEARVKGHHVEVSVADTGAGIAPEHLPHIFERFYRAGDSTPGESSGSGLGLSIAKGLVEAMHGKIGIESRPGKGTRVVLTLPQGSGQQPLATGQQAVTSGQ